MLEVAEIAGGNWNGQPSRGVLDVLYIALLSGRLACDDLAGLLRESSTTMTYRRRKQNERLTVREFEREREG